MIIPYEGHEPNIHESCYISRNAIIVGRAILKENVNIWYGTVVRADDNYVTIGENTNIQDNSTIHISREYETIIGKDVTVGHGAIVHACTVGNNVLVGMGSIILNGAKIGDNVIIGAGSLVPPRKVIPSNTLVMGSPAKVVRELTQEDVERIKKSAQDYIHLANRHKKADK
ncbi:MAG: gamma carbonic anhydrase family protein [Anaeromicrobium sp.]|jgi:carbonic anhydrase/acetyltransferase-like protein (isoleucine patch superfamily)|uniref:gamma carbonic anhydrase family protein n=1 Tax=Anaeromicrobium sp. TaxID=1929132 RepID=UPI0025E60131|nr:gamma carbonic anhydrase family protein [Anaeromicrobium sp.]MCT4595016.1 gamma carbonic anhydrase family protein [Anaeromicrobium sp.]